MKKIMNTIRNNVQSASIKAHCFIQDRKGDLATNTIGAIIVAVVIIGLLIAAVNTFFPGFFTEMFNSMKTKLNGHW